MYHATCLGFWNLSASEEHDSNRPLDRVWGILLPLFGMYFPKVQDTAIRTKRADNVALIIFMGLLEDEEQAQRKKNK